ncbi:MAG: response regulator [Ruminococcaceae bacterium]|nr:response regulator [Oscillospiraceae bacterium]
MEKLKILVADNSEEFCRSLADALRGVYRVRVCRDGSNALEILQNFKPDVCIVDLMLSGVDGITLLQKILQMGLRPVVLATTRYVSDYILESVDKLHVGYLMVKPCAPEAVLSRLADMTQQSSLPVFAHPDPRTQVSNMLLSLGISTKLRGYGYLREAILLMVNRPHQSITKELYPTVATNCGVTAVQVERSIRSAIHSAFPQQDRQLWQTFFPTGENGVVKRPTNSTVISCLADRLALCRNNLPE